MKKIAILSNGLSLYATPTGLKEGSKGKVRNTSSVLYDVIQSKSERRKVRKALRKAGYVKHASDMNQRKTIWS